MELGNMRPRNNNRNNRSNRPSTSNRNNRNNRGTNVNNNNNNNSHYNDNKGKRDNVNHSRNRAANHKGKREFPRPCRFCNGLHYDNQCPKYFNALPTAVETSTTV